MMPVDMWITSPKRLFSHQGCCLQVFTQPNSERRGMNREPAPGYGRMAWASMPDAGVRKGASTGHTTGRPQGRVHPSRPVPDNSFIRHGTKTDEDCLHVANLDAYGDGMPEPLQTLLSHSEYGAAFLFFVGGYKCSMDDCS